MPRLLTSFILVAKFRELEEMKSTTWEITANSTPKTTPPTSSTNIQNNRSLVVTGWMSPKLDKAGVRRNERASARSL
jgi:hypothetical protein